MDRVRATSSVTFASRDLTPGTGTPQYFTNGVPGSVAATVLPGYWVNMVMDELMALVTAARITPDDTNWNQVWQSLFRSITFQDAGGVNHLIIALPAGVTFPAGAVGLGTTFQVKAANTNTAAVDFAPFGLPAVAVQHPDGSAITAGEIIAGGIYTLVNNGAGVYQMIGGIPAGGLANFFDFNVVVKNTPGADTWTVPPNVHVARFKLHGGGGGGGGIDVTGGASTWGCSSGGGGGAYGEVTLKVTPAEVIAITVGAAGAAGASGDNNGGDGGSTQITQGITTYIAGGGQGGEGTAPNAAGNSRNGGTIAGTGTFDFSCIGQPSGGGIVGYAAATGELAYGGKGGDAVLGGWGGQGGTDAGNPGWAPGGGGAGAAESNGASNKPGTAGAAGRVLIEYFTG